MLKNSRTYIPIIFTLIILTISCYRIMPAGFWKSFKSDLIIKSESDQGPWGGYRYIRWQGNKKNIFTSRLILDFAIKNNWNLTDSTLFKADSIKSLINSKKLPTDYSDEILISSVFKKLELNDLKVFRFKTGWIAVRPGNARDTDRNGFIILNSSRSQMTVYHLWGE